MIRLRWPRRLLLWTLLSVSLLVLTGCWDQRAPQNTAVVLAIAVSDRNEWTFLFPNPTVTVSSLSSLSNTKQYYSITVQAPSFAEAFQEVQRRSARAIFVGDLKLLVVSDALTVERLTPILEGLVFNGVVPAKLWLAASAAAPESLLLHVSPQTIVPVYYLSSYFDCVACHPVDLGTRLWEWWDRLMTPGVSPTMPLVLPTAQGADVRQILVYPTRGQPLVMPQAVTEGWAFLTGKVRSSALNVQVDGQRYVVAPIRARTFTTVTLTTQAVNVKVVIHAQGQIAELPHNISARATELAVARATSEEIVRLCLDALTWANRTQTDPFGYAERAAWFQNEVAATIPPRQWVHLPIQARVRAQVVVQGEGVAR